MSSVAELAYLKRLDQGNHECEVLPEGAEAAKQWEKCTKNPGHDKFIPVKEFSLSHLPKEFQDKQLFNYIMSLAVLTVKVVVMYASTDRPEAYPFSNSKGENKVPHTGSGCVYQCDPHYIGKFTCTKTCPCPDCGQSSSPETVWWECRVVTARHVIYNTEEAKNTFFEVFFDDDSQSTVKKLYGIVMFQASTEDDRCEVVCVTHDSEVAKKLNHSLLQSYSIIRRLVAGCSDYLNLSNAKRNLCVVISHPHGCSKHISVGYWTDCLKKWEDRFLNEFYFKNLVGFIYNTPTCRGSSGGPLFILHWLVGRWSYKFLNNYFCHTHSEGSIENGENVNKSSFFVAADNLKDNKASSNFMAQDRPTALEVKENHDTIAPFVGSAGGIYRKRTENNL